MVWPFSPRYPEKTVADVDGKTFDYIVVGGGTAACVLAARLSEDPSVTVLVLSRGKIKDDWLSSIPLLSQGLQKDGPQVSVLYSEPDERWDGARVHTYTSRALGGATRINGLMLTKGTPGLYDSWAACGNDKWSFKECEPYFRKMENASLNHPDAPGRGQHGPLLVQHQKSLFTVDDYLTKTANDVGVPVGGDLNDPSGPAIGLFDVDIMIDEQARRLSSQLAYLPKAIAIKRQGHLTICGGAVATRLEVNRDGSEVTGVYVVDGESKRRPRQCFVKARREVIVCCGALFSPQVLMLSGIGPKPQLAKHNIPVIRDMPGVGANLKDHISFGVAFEVLPSDSWIYLLRPLVAIWSFLVFVVFKTGYFASITTQHCIFIRSGAIDGETMEVKHFDTKKNSTLDAHRQENIPDIEYILCGHSMDEDYVKQKGYYSLYATLLQPFSSGRIELASDDPLTNPRIASAPRDIPSKQCGTARLVSELAPRRAAGATLPMLRLTCSSRKESEARFMRHRRAVWQRRRKVVSSGRTSRCTVSEICASPMRASSRGCRVRTPWPLRTWLLRGVLTLLRVSGPRDM
ncbi:L-sorbose 1-dehydrogenase like protein [Verticillium longisporum]|nr:L-sorbose 1-dehydrogenase like protein [Verticillium longisporum]